MEPVSIGLFGILTVLILLALGMPIAFSLLSVGFFGIGLLTSFDTAAPVTVRCIYDETAHYPYMVIPLFIVMGSFAGASGMTQQLYSSLNTCLHRLPAALAIASIAACAAFAAVSGSAVATTATLGSTTLPEMRRYRYANSLATGSIAAGGTLGFLIPPSLGFVVYGMLTEQSVGQLLIAGIIPGILLASLFVLVIICWVLLRPQDAPSLITSQLKTNQKYKRTSFAEYAVLAEPLFLFAIVMFGIYGGIFTPTEAGAVGATLLFLLAFFKKRLSWYAFKNSLLETLHISVMTLFLVAGATVFARFLALSTIPMLLSLWAASLQLPQSVIIIVIICGYLLLGCFLDAISMMVLTMPVVLPILQQSGCDLIWFGVIAVLMMQAGLITPPLGLNIFTIAGIAKDVKIQTIFIGVLPFLLAIFLVVGLLLVIPDIALFLPKQMR